MTTEGKDSRGKALDLTQLRPAASDVSGTVGLFGGSFDPLHIGHLALCDYILAYPELSGLTQIWFMPTPQNPLKEQGPTLPYTLRCHMIEQAIQSDPRYELCTIESMLPEPHYTLETLTALPVVSTWRAYRSPATRGLSTKRLRPLSASRSVPHSSDTIAQRSSSDRDLLHCDSSGTPRGARPAPLASSARTIPYTLSSNHSL